MLLICRFSARIASRSSCPRRPCGRSRRGLLELGLAELADRGHVDRVVQLRLPRVESRCTVRPPEENSTGAVPL